jgi:hypothetical protein
MVSVALSGLVGCFGRERVEPLRDDAGRQVALEYVCPISVRDIRSGRPLPDAVVYLSNDEDPVAQVGWTDASGLAVLSQRYARGTVVVRERSVLGLFSQEESREVRFPGFGVRSARAGYLPVEERFTGEDFAPGLEVGIASARARLTEPVAVSLDPVPARGPPVRHAAVLFAAPPPGAIRVGARGTVHDGRYTRLSSEQRGRLEAACRALLGPSGERVLICASVPVATARFHSELEALASSADTVLYLPPLGPTLPVVTDGPLAEERRRALRQLNSRLGLVAEQPAARPGAWRVVAAPAGAAPAPPPVSEAFLDGLVGWASLDDPDEIGEKLRVIAFTFAADLEHGRGRPASLAGEGLVVELAQRVATGRTLAVVCEPEVAGILERQLRERRYRALAETWLPAWMLR